MYLYRGHSASTSLGNGEGVDEESNKNWHRNEGMQSKKWSPSHKFFYVLFSVTQSLYHLGFSWSPDNITASNKNSTPKKELSSVSEMTIQYLHKNLIIPLPLQCELFIEHVYLKIQLSQVVIFTSFDITWYAEAAIYAKDLLFSHSIVSWWSLVNTTGEMLE